MSAKEKLAVKWHKAFKKATDFDSWGQVVEATDEYAKLAKQLRSSLNNVEWQDDQKKVISKVASCLECRSKMLHSVGGSEELSLKDVRRLDTVLKNLSSSSMKEIPTDLNVQIDRVRKRNAISTPSPELTQVDDLDDGEEAFTSKINALLPKLPSRPGISLVTVNIVKIGLKDATDYIDPYFVISCKDSTGIDLCRTQNTPTPTTRDDTYLFYNVNVELQVPLEEMNKGTAVFFEMRYYKPKRRMTATRCYAFMEVDEMKPGPCVIELYRKPVDYRRRKLTLLTSKPLYLHLALTITSE